MKNNIAIITSEVLHAIVTHEEPVSNEPHTTEY